MLKKTVLLLGLMLSAAICQDDLNQSAVPPCEEEVLFGENPTLRHLLEDGLSFRKDMMRTKEAYLKLYEEQFKRIAMEAKMELEHAFDTERNGYEAGIAWNLFGNGYFGSRSVAKEKKLQKSIAFEHDIDAVLSNYAEVAYYEMEDIKRTILYRYAQKRYLLLQKGMLTAQKKLHQGLLTRFAYERIKTAYEKSKKAKEYLFVNQPKSFDRKYRKLITAIETKKLIDAQKLIQLTLAHAPSIKIEQQKLMQSTMNNDWRQHLKAELHVEQKEYTFVKRQETLGGLQVRIPLEGYSKNRELVRLEKEYSRQKMRSLKLILGKKVGYLYDRITYNREQIDRMQKERTLAQHQLEQYRYKVSHPAGERMRTRWENMLMTEVNILDLEQNIWIARADILSALLKLQYLSGVRLIR